MSPPRCRAAPVTSTTRPMRCYFLLRRWTRVRLSSLRCFFLAMRLRRFLTTEPIEYLIQSAKIPAHSREA